jgi:hypothetical protein
VRNPALTPLTNAGAGLDSPDDLAFEDWLARLDTLADAHQRLRSNQRCNRQPGRSEPSGERCSSMKATISVAGVELPDEESCGRLQDRHVVPQPTVLRPQPADLLVLLDRDPGRLAAVNVGLGDPASQRLPPTPTCLDTVSTAAACGRVLGPVLQHQPDGSGPQLGDPPSSA